MQYDLPSTEKKTQFLNDDNVGSMNKLIIFLQNN